MTKTRASAAIGPLLVALAAAAPAAAQWGQFRGPNGAGIDASAGYPVVFSPTDHVIWKAALPFARSSPVVVGSHVYVTATEGERLLTICLDAATGHERWRRETPRAHKHEIYRANDPAAPTPAADADGVVVFFPDYGLVAYATDGTERWTLPLGPFKNFYGMAASPIIAADLVVMLCDQSSGSFMLALDRKTGQQRWRQQRPSAPVSWTTPMVFQPAGNAGIAELVVLGSTRLDAYALDTGEPRWWLPLASNGSIGTAVAHGDAVLLSTLSTSEPWMETFDAMAAKFDADRDGRITRVEFEGERDWRDHFGWIDADSDGVIVAPEWVAARDMGIGEYGVAAVRPAGQRGKLDPSSVRWRFKKNLPYIPSPLVYQDLLYMVKDGGIVTTLDAATGQTLKEGRATGAAGKYVASPIAADGKVFLASADGKVTVLKAGPQWDVLGVNDLGDEIQATPALSAGRIYVRTRGMLYCFGAAKD